MRNLNWRRILIYAGVLLALAIPASAAPPTFCCPAVSGHTITAADYNNNLTPLYSALNGNIDSTFISSNGIGANQIKSGCTGCTGTFGFAATFSGVLTASGQLVIGSSADANEPLAVNGHSATQSAALMDINQSSGGTNVMDVSNTGTLATRVTTDASVVAKFQGNSATQSGDIIDGYQSGGGTQLLGLKSTGDLDVCPTTPSSPNTCTLVAPVYLIGGGNVHAGFKQVGPTTLATDTAGTCATLVNCSIDVNSLTLTAGAVFTSNTTFSCNISDAGSNNVSWTAAPGADGAHVGIGAHNITAGTLGDETVVTFTLTCWGY